VRMRYIKATRLWVGVKRGHCTRHVCAWIYRDEGILEGSGGNSKIEGVGGWYTRQVRCRISKQEFQGRDWGEGVGSAIRPVLRGCWEPREEPGGGVANSADVATAEHAVILGKRAKVRVEGSFQGLQGDGWAEFHSTWIQKDPDSNGRKNRLRYVAPHNTSASVARTHSHTYIVGHTRRGAAATKREGIKNSHWAKRLHNGGREGGKGGKGTGGRARIVRTECGEIEHGILVSNRYGSCESTADGTFPVIYE